MNGSGNYDFIDVILKSGLEFAKLGPIGFGTLIFVLVAIVFIVNLVSGRDFSNTMARQMRLFMMLGAACFAISVAAFLVEFFVRTPHQLTLVYSPDLQSVPLSEPKIVVSGQEPH